MSFSATQQFTGVPDFNVIDINPTEVAKALQVYLDRGSKLVGVSLDDINRSVLKQFQDPSKVTLVDLITAGMKMFDAIVWLSGGRPSSHPLIVDPTMDKSKIPSLFEQARALFYVYFFLVTQARYPVKTGIANAPKVSNFLTTIMGMDKSQSYYIELLCSFDAAKFDPSWAKAVKFGKFGQETLSRFGLGVAGYRMFSPFKLYTIRPDAPTNLQNAARFAERVAKASPTWDIHPLTRDPAILTSRGNLNKNLGNLILDVFTDEQIAEMVTAKVLYQKPMREPNHRNYMSWADNDDVSGSQGIFH